MLYVNIFLSLAFFVHCAFSAAAAAAAASVAAASVLCKPIEALENCCWLYANDFSIFFWFFWFFVFIIFPLSVSSPIDYAFGLFAYQLVAVNWVPCGRGGGGDQWLLAMGQLIIGIAERSKFGA